MFSELSSVQEYQGTRRRIFVSEKRWHKYKEGGFHGNISRAVRSGGKRAHKEVWAGVYDRINGKYSEIQSVLNTQLQKRRDRQ